MFRRTAPQVEDIGRPLLDEDEGGIDSANGGGVSSSDPLSPIAPSSSRVGIFGIRNTGYTPVTSSQEHTARDAEESARLRAEDANRIALDRQRANQTHFEQDMANLESEVIREGKIRAEREEADRKLALQLAAQEEERGERRNIDSTALMVTVPRGLSGGQMMAVAVPGLGRTINIMVPHGLQGGDTFHFRIPRNATLQPQQQHQVCSVRIPAGLRPGQAFTAMLPNNRALLVVVPPGARQGDELRIRFNEETGVEQRTGAVIAPPAQTGARCARPVTREEVDSAAQNESLAVMQSLQEAGVVETAEQRAEREAFLAALPEDMRAEVIAQETAQRRRLGSYRDDTPSQQQQQPQQQPRLTAEQEEFLSSLPEELRDEVERDLLAQAAANVATPPPPPPAIVQPPLIDLWGGSSNVPASSAPPMFDEQPSRQDTAPLSPPSSQQPYDAGLDMFQNLAVRGVSAKKSPASKTEEI